MESEHNRDNTKVLYAAIGVLLLVVGALGGYLIGSDRAPPPVATQQTAGVAGAPAQRAVNLPQELIQFLSGWNCPCGCGDLLLDCPCNDPNGAQEVQTYVKNLYDDRIPLDDIRARVVERYGASVVGGLM